MVCPAALAQPMLHVRAETRIELSVDASRDVLVGVLRDDRGEALSGRAVEVTIEEGARTTRTLLTTDARGEFEQPVTPGGEYAASARFGGDADHTAQSVARTLRVDRDDLHLRLIGETQIDLDAPHTEIRVEGRTLHGAEGLGVELSDELGRAFARAPLDPDGVAVFSLAGQDFGAPGAGYLRAAFEGSEAVSEARAELAVVRFRHPSLSLRMSRDSVAQEGSVELTGVLRDSQSPLHDRAVTLLVDGRERETVLTNTEGRYQAHFEPTPDDRGVLTVRAIFSSDGPGHPSVESPATRLRISAASAWRWLWSGVPLLLCVLTLWLLRRRREPAEEAVPVTAPGVQIAQRRLGARSRRLSGRVQRARDGRPIEGELRLERDGAPFGSVPVESGQFSTELDPGRWRITVVAQGCAPFEVELVSPHHGEWDDVTFRVVTWRDRSLSVLRDAVQATRPGAWAKKTVHELGHDPILGRLAADVENAYYGPRDPDAADVSALEAMSAQTAPARDFSRRSS